MDERYRFESVMLGDQWVPLARISPDPRPPPNRCEVCLKPLTEEQRAVPLRIVTYHPLPITGRPLELADCVSGFLTAYVCSMECGRRRRSLDQQEHDPAEAEALLRKRAR